MSGWGIFWLVVVVVLLIRAGLFAYRIATGTTRWAHAARTGPGIRQRVSIPWRPGNDKLHAAARDAARDLIATILGRQPPHGGTPPAGLVLHTGERALQAASAGYAHRGTLTRRVGGLKVDFIATRRRWRGHWKTDAGWVTYGHVPWLITNLRLAALLPGDEHPTTIWWNNITSIATDSDKGTLALEDHTGWRGLFYGPTIAPITVAAIAHRHGLHALATEPSLAWLRDNPAEAGLK